jgi:hypothetical protein
MQDYDYSLLRKGVFGSVFSAQEIVKNCYTAVIFNSAGKQDLRGVGGQSSARC